MGLLSGSGSEEFRGENIRNKWAIGALETITIDHGVFENQEHYAKRAHHLGLPLNIVGDARVLNGDYG